MAELIGDAVAAALMRDGTEVEIRTDKYHFRAYNIDEQQVGQPFCKINDLLKDIGAELIAVKDPAAVGEKENIAGGRDKSVKEQGSDLSVDAGHVAQEEIPGDQNPPVDGLPADI